ncbi:MAG: CoA transferase [Chloroflexi bacterium]|nr:CoA transferase [Chloroflexota bacterium]MCH8010108.1 CoA transferase [Chloroflexota bacterium]
MQALEGIRIIDMARLGPGPHCSQILADMGADVIRVEAPDPKEGPRAGRMIKLPGDAAIRRNSRSISLNLKTEEGKQVFFKLAATADVVTEGFRPGVVKRLGVDYEAVKAVRPQIVYASLSGYGQEGPYSSYVGHDINYQGITGMLDMTGERDGPPMIPGNTIADNAGGGMNAAISILAALLSRERTGASQYIDMAMVDGLVTMMFFPIEEHLTTGTVPHRSGTITTGLYPWYSIYETKDGKYVSVGAIEPWFYENLCRLLEREELIPHQYGDDAKQQEVFAAFREAFLTKTRDEWVELLMPGETCVGPVLAIDEVVKDPHLRHREMIVDIEEEGGGTRTQVGIMAKLSETPGAIRTPGPEVGQHTPEILSELGYDEPAIEALRRSEAIA